MAQLNIILNQEEIQSLLLNDLLSSSQIIQLENQYVIGHINRFAIYDLAVMGVSTLGGIFAFGKADLK